MKRYILLGVISIIGFLLFGCNGGGSSESDVLDDLGSMLDNTTSYYAEANMTVKHHNQTRDYDLEIHYKDGDKYKVNLTNLGTDNSQVIIKNDEGVFVLTPSLNKSFKFDTNWPENGSHAYLLQSVLQDAFNNDTSVEVKDGKILITSAIENEAFGSDLKQVTTINEDSKEPEKVILYDESNSEVVKVEYTTFEYNLDVNDDEFDIEKSMNDSRDEGYETPESRSITYPTYFPMGSIIKESDMQEERGTIVFEAGNSGFTVIQEFVDDSETVSTKEVSGNVVVLKGGVAIIDDSSIVWYENGVEYMIYSENLSAQELVKIANSFIQDTEK